MSRSISHVLMWLAAGQLATIGVAAPGQGVGPAKSVKLVFLAFDNVDVRLWIDGKPVVARHMVVPDWSTSEDVTLDAKVRRRSRIVLMFGDKRREATIGSIATLKTIYIEPNGPMKMSSDPPALD
jgi:hypothetical protein